MKNFAYSQDINRIFLLLINVSLLILSCGPSLSELVRQKNYNELKVKLEKGSDPNKIDKKTGKPPLAEAIIGDDIDIIEILLRHGADVNLPYIYRTYEERIFHDEYSFSWGPTRIEGTPIIEALFLEKSDQIVMFLIENGADFNAKDTHNKTPLVFAVKQNRTNLVDYLLEKGAIVNTSYVYASGRKYPSGPLGLNIFSNVPVYTYSERTILELAESEGNHEIISMLKQNPHDICLSGVWVYSESVAKEILSALRSSTDFVELVKKYSVGPGKDEDGYLGCFSPLSKKEEIKEEIKNAIENLDFGEYSEIVKIDSYYAIFVKVMAK